MCGIVGLFGRDLDRGVADAMVAMQHHRGPDGSGVFVDPSGQAVLGHARLSILDLSPAGAQPMASRNGRFQIVLNGEIYNYLELRAELSEYPFRSRSDTEVVLAAYERWGDACVDRFIGMFALLVWDVREQRLFAARDRFGVKPLVYHQRSDGTFLVASEIKALWAAGVPACPDDVTWATYLTRGVHEHTERTFWADVASLPAGHALTWRNGRTHITRWYDLAERVGPEVDERPAPVVRDEYLALLTDSVRLRFRSDVPVGIALSGGLDSSILLGLVQRVQGEESAVQAFTFTTGHPDYDELSWVRQTIARTRHPLLDCRLTVDDVPELAASVQWYEDEPFGGLPTLAYARLFEHAREHGVIVLLDGQGLDEQWCGYDYYARALAGGSAGAGVVQGAAMSPVRPECLTPEFRALSEPLASVAPFTDPIRNLQYRDARFTKIPRALRFNDRASMRASVELREPFLDHRLFELALRQPTERKIAGGVHKRLLREVAADLLPDSVVQAPKRALQTPQREWLRGPLREWADGCIENAIAVVGGSWLDADAVRSTWRQYTAGAEDTSFFVWQWVSLGMLSAMPAVAPVAERGR